MKTSMETSMAPLLALLAFILVQIGLSDAGKCYNCEETYVHSDKADDAKKDPMIGAMFTASAKKEKFDTCWADGDDKKDCGAISICLRISKKQTLEKDGVKVMTEYIKKGCAPNNSKAYDCKNREKELATAPKDWTAEEKDKAFQDCMCEGELCNGAGSLTAALATVVVGITVSLFH